MLLCRLLAVCVLFCAFACQKNKPLEAERLPPDAIAGEAAVTDLNHWVEQGRFCVTGVCSNPGARWQKIWLEAQPLDAAGQPLSIAGHKSAALGTFSDAVPPQGRTAFFATWPLSDLSGEPASCRITRAWTQGQIPGPILVVQDMSSLKMYRPGAQPEEELAWKIDGALFNPLKVNVSRVSLELLLYGTDNRLWFSTRLHPDDPATRQILSFEGKGPLLPGEKRPFALQVFYEHLPAPLKEKKIGRIEVLAYEAR